MRIFSFRSVLTFILLSIICLTSCGLFDKEIKQDRQIAVFKYKLIKIQDSLDNHLNRVQAYETIINEISNDPHLITPRKKNNLLIEGNIYLSNEYLKEKDYKKAIHYADIIIGLDSVYPRGYYTKGCIYQVMNEDSLALAYYDKATSLYPEYTDAYYNRGIIYEEQEKYNKALDDYNKVIKLNPPYIASVYNNRGNIHLAKDDDENAIKDYSKAIDIDSTSTKTYCNRAWAYTLQEEYDKALADCNKALSLDSLYINAYSKRASIYELTEKYEEAIEDYKKIMKLDPFNKSGMYKISKQTIQKLKLSTPTNK